MKRDQLIVALDLESAQKAREIVSLLGNTVIFYKVGMRLFTKEGPPFIAWLKKKKKKIFLDLKFHDIPNTVAQAVESATQLGVDLLTIHASGGPEMLEAAAKSARAAARKYKKPRPQIFAVTVLTSLSDLSYLGLSDSISDQALRLARLALKSKLDGVVCSPQEIKMIKRNFGKKLKVLSPGIRFEEKSADDQKRIASPLKALREGADYLVIGRPILLSAKPREMVRRIFSSVK